MTSFHLQNGAIVQWTYPDAFQNASLKVIKAPEGNPGCGGCGNPWNMMTKKEDEQIRKQRPPNRVNPCKIDSMMYNKVYTSAKDLGEAIKHKIGCDCWGVFITNADRSKVFHVYFDHRKKDDKEQKERRRLLKDPSDLVDDVCLHGLTVVIVMGCSRFMEYYFFKVATNLYLSVKVDHCINV